MPAWLQPRHALGRRPARRRSLLPAVVVLLSVMILAGVLAWLDPLPPRFSGTAVVSDGDSLRIGGDRIRLTGFDAPELDQVCWREDGSEWSCGREARAAMRGLLEGGEIACRPEGEDKYGRVLARCSVGETDLGASMVSAGLAARKQRPGANAAASGRGASTTPGHGATRVHRMTPDRGSSNSCGYGSGS